MNLFRPALGACGAAVLAASCAILFSARCAPAAPPVPPPVPQPPLGPYVRKPGEVGVDRLLNGPAMLSLAGAEGEEITLSSKKVGENIVVDVLLHGTPFEREVYSMTDRAFYLKEAAAERYEDPIPLLMFPMSVGTSWQWEGTCDLEGQKQVAYATVGTENSTVSEKGGNVPAIKVSVDLDITLKGATARRMLEFWFVEGRGIVQRKFGDASVRSPK